MMASVPCKCYLGFHHTFLVHKCFQKQAVIFLPLCLQILSAGDHWTGESIIIGAKSLFKVKIANHFRRNKIKCWHHLSIQA